MKKIILPTLSLLILSFISCSDDPDNDIIIEDQEEGIIDIVYRDGSPILGTNESFSSYSFLNETLGYLCTTQGRVFKYIGSGAAEEVETLENGYGWQSVKLLTEQDIFLVSHRTDTINRDNIDDYTMIFKSSDGGQTWKSVFELEDRDLVINDFYFFDESFGFAYGSSMILKTNDGGESWSTVEPYDTPSFDRSSFYYSQVIFTDSQNGFAVGSKGNSSTSISDAIMMHTTDGGTTWSEVSLPTNTTTGEMPPIEQLFVAENSLYIVTWQGTIYRSNDGGTEWVDISDFPYIQIEGSNKIFHQSNKVYFTSANRGFSFGKGQNFSDQVGIGNSILFTADGGETWNGIKTFQDQSNSTNVNISYSLVSSDSPGYFYQVLDDRIASIFIDTNGQ